MVCSSGGWLEQFGCLVIAPQTAVDFTVTIVSAGIAALIAVLVLKSQFRHDRKLAADQLARADLHAQAAAKLPHVREVARALVELGAPAGHEFTAISMGRYGIAVLETRQDPASAGFVDLLDTAGLHLPEAEREQVRSIWGDIVTRRALCHDAAKLAVPIPPPGGFHPELPIPRGIGLAAQNVLSTATSRAERVGQALYSWDGFSTLDLKPALRGWTRRYPDGPDENAERDRSVRTAFWRAMLIFVPSEDRPRDVSERLVSEVGPLDPAWLHEGLYDSN